MQILCSVATRGRYHTTLPLVLNAIINQTRLPDKLVIFDDNDEPKDMRKEMLYQYFFKMLDIKGVKWEWLFAQKKGQHHIHQMANTMGYDWVWRVDDDAVPEPNVLERLFSYANELSNAGMKVGAVGGSILTPPIMDTTISLGDIDKIDSEPNIQWGIINQTKEVMHLHCSFLYKAGVYDYNLGLSRVAHREETLFTYGLYQKGYKLLTVPNAVTWHLKNSQGGIRSESKQEMYYHDEQIFKNFLENRNNTIVVLNCGLGDHIVFSHVLPDLKNPIVFGCYPELIPCRSIAESQHLFGNIDQWNIYKKMDQWKWKGSLEDAFRKLYL
jgi:GT2 family glycosyltransferase